MQSWLPVLLLTAILAANAAAGGFKVLVVMSYEESNPWVREIRAGIESVLQSTSEITYFHMNTKADRDGGPKRAEEAFALYQQLQPDGLIAADDDAQEMFVLPYLKGKARTPIMFNGVNADPAKYGFPTDQISGVLERAHVRESLAFIRQLLPAVRSVCFLTNDVPAGHALRAQVEAEKASYPARVAAFHFVASTAGIGALEKSLRAGCDALFVDSLEGIVDGQGRALTNSEVLTALARHFSAPILAGNRYQVEQGAWAAVVKSGQEQGETAAEMLHQAMLGTPVAAIPVVRNTRGQRVINVTALEAHGVALRPTLFRGATLVRQQR